MIHIFTSVVNRPDFVLLQEKLFKKFLQHEYKFHVVDDSVDPSITEQFEIACSLNEIEYYRKPAATKSMSPAQETVLILFSGLMIILLKPIIRKILYSF